MYKLKEEQIKKQTKTHLDLEKPKTTMFYNEIVGIILILFTIIIALRLGDIGLWLYKISKVIFGEVYFLYLIIFLYIGFTNVFNHKRFDVKNQKFVGVVILLLDISIFCHIPIHNYIVGLDGSYFKNTLELYYMFLEDIYLSILGGGIIGGLLFFILYKMFSFSGVVIIALLILVFSISIFVNKSFNEIFYSLKGVFKLIKTSLSSFNNFFKYDIGVKKHISYKKSKFILPIKLFELPPNNIKLKFHEKIALDNKVLIENILRKLNLEFRFCGLIVSYNTSLYKYYIESNFDKKQFYSEFKRVISSNVLIGFSDNKLVVELTLDNPETLYLRTILLKQTSLKNNFIIPIGIDSYNELIEIDFTKLSGILIEANGKNAKNIISSIVYSIYVKNHSNFVKFRYFDESSNLDDIFNNDFNTTSYNIISFLDDFINLVDRRLKILEKNKCNDISEYNIKQEIDETNKILEVIILVINTKNEIDDALVNQKLFYILSSSIKTGINVIYYKEIGDNHNEVFRLFDHIIYFKNSSNINSRSLNSECDCILKANSKTKRVTIPKVFDSENLIVKEYLKK